MITDDELKKFYNFGEKTISDCARYLNTSTTTTRNRLKKLGVYNEILKPQKINFSLSKNDAEKYISDGKTIKEIALIVGAPQTSISKLLKEYNIDYKKKPNKHDIPDKDVLYGLYYNENKTFMDIAKLYSVSNVTVKKWFSYHDIKTRSHIDTHKNIVSHKVKQTNIERYGTYSLFNTKEFQEVCMNSRISKYGTLHPQLNNKTENDIRSFFEELSSKPFTSTTNILKTHEIDGYNEELRIAFEYCGLYWHNETNNGRGKYYHYTKYRKCTEANIRLITIFEDEWRYRNTQVKGFLKSILFPNMKKVYARNTEIKRIGKYEASEFINRYHIQPLDSNHILYSYGIFFENELLGVMSFGKHHRKNDKNDIVLNRLVFKDEVTIIGGASKLLSYAIQNDLSDLYDRIISWSDNRWSVGNVYEKLNFCLDKEYKTDYSYVFYSSPKTRIPKQSMTKKKLKCSPDQTESEKAYELGYARIWDCGKKRWIFNIK